MQPLPVEGFTHVEGQIDALAILPPHPPHAAAKLPLIALASSRLEGSTWDGAITLLHFHCKDDRSLTLTSAGPVCPSKYGIPALTWCGGGGQGAAGVQGMLAAAQDNGDVQVFHLTPSAQNDAELTLTPFTTLAEHDDLVSALASSTATNSNEPSSTTATTAMLASGSWDCSVRVWDLARPMTSVRQFLAHVAPITALAWRPPPSSSSSSPQQELLASASRDKSVKCWDLRAKNIGDCARLLEGMPHAALSLAWLPGGAEQTFALGLEDGSVALVDVRRPGVLLAERRLHATRASVVLPSPSSSSPLLASGGDDGGVAVTPLVAEECGGDEGGDMFSMGDSATCPKLHTDYVRALGWLDGGSPGASPILLSGGWDGDLKASSWSL